MEQHAVPQEISSYQFHLVGDMTLKQFLELAGGVLVGVFFYALQIPGIIKWPLILISAGAGAAIAFIPFEERPLEQWVFAFFRAIYMPTIFDWDNTSKEEVFAPEEAAQTMPAPAATSVKPSFPNKLEEAEVSFLSRVSKLFTPSLTTVELKQTPPVSSVPTTPPVAVPKPVAVNTNTIPLSQNSVPNARLISMEQVNPVVAQPQTGVSSTPKVQVPTIPTISVPAGGAAFSPAQQTASAAAPIQRTTVEQTLVGQTFSNTSQAQFSTTTGLTPPERPNTIIGQVVGSDGKIVEGAIIEIRDEAGRPVRALRTNKAGHFLSVTPLSNGKYQIITEVEGMQFDPQVFDAIGGIVQPIMVKARA